MTTFLFGNSNRRHIANPHNPDTTLCGIDGYRTAERFLLIPHPRSIEQLMALPLCPTCHQTQEAKT